MTELRTDDEKQAILMDVSVAALVPSTSNPRVIDKDAETFLDLVDSVKAAGVSTPIDIRDHPTKEGKYEIVAGERRYWAAKIAERDIVPAIYHEGMSDRQAFHRTFSENYARQDLTPFETGRAVMTLLADNEIGAVAEMMGKTRYWVRRHAKLQDLSKEWQAALADPMSDVAWMSMTEIMALSKYPADVRADVLDHAKKQYHFKDDAGKNFTKWLAKEYMHRLQQAPWDTAEKEIAGKKACSKCNKRSGCQADLWSVDGAEITDKQDQCLDKACWWEKLMVALNVNYAALKAEHPNLVVVINTNDWTSHETTAIGEELGVEVLYDWKWASAKKSDDGSVAAMVAMGPGLGKMKWIKGGNDGGAPSGIEATTGGPTPLPVRRDRLNRRRWLKVLARVEEALDHQLDPPSCNVLFGMAAFWGIQPIPNTKFGSFYQYGIYQGKA